MRRSWLGLRLLLSCALLLAVFAVGGKGCKEKESSSEEEHHEKRHLSAEECCEKRCHHEEEDCCCLKRCHHEEEDCCCEKRCHHEEEDCCCLKRCHHEEEDCCCEKRCHHAEEDCCCEKKHHHEDEDCCEKRHSRVKEESGEKKHSHGDEEEDEKEHLRVGKKHSKKRRPHLEEPEEAHLDSSELDKRLAESDQRRLTEQSAQSSDAVPNHRREQAVNYYNHESDGPYYKPLEDGQLEIKKAIGIMVYVHAVLGKTNCTKPESQEADVEYSRAYLETEGCQLLPQLEQEKHNCTFAIFMDMRTDRRAVVHQDCTAIPRMKPLYQRFRDLAS